MKKLLLLVLITHALHCASYSQERTISGTVFADRNNNGIRDACEKKLRGVAVSNGDTIVFTDRKGAYEIKVSESDCAVFPILPSDYTMVGEQVINSNFKQTGGSRVDFPLTKTAKRTNFRIAAVGDVQVKDSTQLSYAARSIFTELSNRTDIDFAVYLGDMVNDNMELLPSFMEQLKEMPHHSWSVAGNHDLDWGSPRKPATYAELFGSPDYAFNYGDVLFIVLDNVTGYGSKGYTGKWSDRQMRFVSNCLAMAKSTQMVVVCQHVPLAGVRDNQAMLALLEGRQRVLILSGHTHMTSRHVHAENISELVAGASCGSWWTGEIGPDGIPLAIQRCGAPRNYYVVDFTPDGYSLQFKGIGLDEGVSMNVWIKGEEVVDKNIEALKALPEGTIVANIFGAAKQTRAMIRIDAGQWLEMTQTDMIAPWVSRIANWNKTAGYPTKYSRRTPLSRNTTDHIWTYQVRGGIEPGSHSIEIHAYDEYGFETRYQRSFIKH